MKHYVSLRQLRLMQMMAILPTTLVFLPGQIFAQSRSGAFYAALLAAVLAYAINIAVIKSAHGASPFRLFKISWGKLGIWAYSAYTLCLLLGIISIWNELFTFLQASVLPRTPPWGVGLLIWAVTAVVAGGDISGLARMTDLLTIGSVILGLVVLLPLLGYIRMDNFDPWTPSSLGSIWQGSLLPVTFLGESVVGIAFNDSVREHDPRRRQRALLQGTCISAAVLVGLVALIWGILGSSLAGEENFPILEAIRDIRLSPFLSRFDIVFVPLWLALIEMKLALWFYIVVRATKRIFRWGTLTTWTAILGAVTLAPSSFAFPSVASRVEYLKQTWMTIAFPILIILVLSSGLMGHLRKGHHE